MRQMQGHVFIVTRKIRKTVFIALMIHLLKGFVVIMIGKQKLNNYNNALASMHFAQMI